MTLTRASARTLPPSSNDGGGVSPSNPTRGGGIRALRCGHPQNRSCRFELRIQGMGATMFASPAGPTNLFPPIGHPTHSRQDNALRWSVILSDRQRLGRLCMVWRIKDWKQVFHLNEATRYSEISWTKFPVNRASGKYRRLMATAEGRTAYAVFIGLVRLAARAKANGVVTATAEDVSFETGIPLPDCTSGMALLSSPSIGWLENAQPIPVQIPGEKRDEPVSQTGTSLSLSSSGSSSLPEGDAMGNRPENDSRRARAPLTSGTHDGHADIPNSVLFHTVLKHYPLQQAIRGAYHVTSEAVYRLAHARHGGDLEAALAWLGDRVRAFAKAKQGAEKRYIPQARNWMERGSYDDDPATWAGEAKPKTAAEMIDEAEEKERKRKAAKGLV